MNFGRGGGANSFSHAMLKGGGGRGVQKVLGSFLCGSLKFSHIKGGGAQKVSTL